MNHFEAIVEQIDGHAGHLDRPLLDASLPRGAQPALQLALLRALSGNFGGGEWTARAGIAGACSVFVYASAADTDPDAIFGKLAKAGASEPGPVLQPTPGSAWLKFAVSGKASGTAASAPGLARVTLSGADDVGLGAYCKVDANLSLREAIASRRGAIPFVLDASDVRALALGDACHTAIGGTLSAKLEFSWADALSGPIAPLRGLLPAGRPLALAVDTRASLAVTLAISDSFRLVFVGRDAETVSVSLHRAGNNAFAIAGGVFATIRLADSDIARDVFTGVLAQCFGTTPEQVAKFRNTLVELLGLFDQRSDRIHALLGAASKKLDRAIDALGLPLVDRRLQQLHRLLGVFAFADPGLAARLGIPLDRLAGIVAQIDGLAGAIEASIGAGLAELLAALGLPAVIGGRLAAVQALLERLSKLEDALLAVASKRIELGLDFDYQRVAIDALVFSATLQRQHADFPRWHRALLRLDIAALLEASRRRGSGVALQSFLQHKTLKRSFSLGLGLGSFYSEKDAVAREWTDTLRIIPAATDGHALRSERRHVLKAFRSRAETLFGSSSVWRGDFAADFLSADEDAVQGRWRFALALGFSSSAAKASESWLLAAADYAALWGVVAEDQVDWLARQLADAGAVGSRVRVEVGYTLDHSAFANRQFIESFASIDDDAAARALAAALQRIEGIPERTDIARRRNSYDSAIRVLLGKRSVDVRDGDAVARFVARNLPRTASALRTFEAGHNPANHGSVAHIAQRTESLPAVVREFRQVAELASLVNGLRPGSPADKAIILRALAGWDLAWRDRYLLRWQVLALRGLAAQAKLLPGASSSRLKVTVDQGGSQTTRIFVAAELG